MIGWLRAHLDGKRLDEVSIELREAKLPLLRNVSQDTLMRAAGHAGFALDEHGIFVE